MRPENKRMMAFLETHGIKATPKYIWSGSLRGTWRLQGGHYPAVAPWTDEIRQKLTELGFLDFDHSPLARYSGNGGLFSVFVRGHNELLGALADAISGRKGE